jgi:formylglycine-generating enzyme required for sulfatase activity
MMGSPESEADRKDNETQHPVTISKPFYMQTTEVTQGQWKALMETEPWKGKEFSQYVKEGDNYPAVYISWNDAVRYCQRLSRITDNTYRLPTEAEWEYACRAETTTTWHFGDDEKALGVYAWYWDKQSPAGKRSAHQVGLKPPNAFGLHDMHGNVLEWCHDYFAVVSVVDVSEQYYEQSPEKDPTGPTSGTFRVLRGGSWFHDGHHTRSAHRSWDAADTRLNYNGFRVVRELD